MLRDRFVVERDPNYSSGPPMFKNRGPASSTGWCGASSPGRRRLLRLEQGGGLNVALDHLLRSSPPAQGTKLRVIKFRVGYMVYSAST